MNTDIPAYGLWPLVIINVVGLTPRLIRLGVEVGF